MNDDLLFQRYSHDKLLGGAPSSVDSAPTKQKHRATLAPRAFHEATTNKTLDWQLEQSIDPLKDLLSD